MNPYVRDRINRRLETLSEERLYQVLDYVEFLESKYADKAAPPVAVLQRFADGVEDTLRAGGLAASTVADAMGFLNKAVGVLGGVAQTTITVATDVAAAARAATVPPPPASSPPGESPPPAPAAPSAAPSAAAPAAPSEPQKS
jgi:hypothetical protein